ncbi:MAG: glycosyltransferase family 39 protein [Weeksellaceae bacterium]|nr:glycosyltransferase family 39 protein [Weeksellaceae bacterium]
MRNLYRVLFFGFLFFLYWFFSFSRVPFGDALGLVNTAEINQFTDNTTVFGKFLYTNFLIGFKTIFGLDSISAARFFNLIFSVLTLAVLFFALKLKFKKERVAYLGTLIFALSFTYWKQTEIIEVYTFNSFWVALYIYFTIRFLAHRKSSLLFISSLILGLSLWSHVQNIMLIPGWLFLCFKSYKSNQIKVLPSIIVFAAFAFGLYFLAFLNGYDTSKVFGSGNSDWVTGSFKKGIFGFSKNMAVAVGYLVYNFWMFIIPGFFVFFQKIKSFRYNQNIFYALSFLVPFSFATIYNVSDNYVFFLNAYLFFIFFIVEGLLVLRNQYLRIYRIFSVSVFCIPFFYLVSYFLVSKTPQGQQFDREKSNKGGLSYYLFPWMRGNVGVLEYYLDEKTPADPMDFMYKNCQEFLKLRKSKNSLEDIKKM